MPDETEKKQELEDTPTQGASEEATQGGTSQEVAGKSKPINLDDFEEFRKYKSARDKSETDLRNELKSVRDMIEALQAGKEYDTTKFEELQNRLAAQDAVEDAKTQMTRSYGHWPGFDASIFSNCRSVQEVNDVVYAWLQVQVTKSQETESVTEKEEKKQVAQSGVDSVLPSEPTEPPSGEDLASKMQVWRKRVRENRRDKSALQEALLETEPLLRAKKPQERMTSKV